VIKGDLEESKFGLSKNKYNILLKKIDSVVHSSAKVNYLDSLDELLKPNLISTKNILEFVFTKKRKYLFYISSLAIFAMGETHGKIDEKFPIEKSISICGGYAQSKWLCEKMIQDLLDKRGITIFRPGLISGDSRSGILNLSDSFSIFIEELMKLKSLPDFNFKKYYFDATPVDFVSDFAFIAFQIQSDKFQIYHLANPRPVSLQVVLDCLLKFGHAYSNSKVNPYFKMQENGLLNSFFGSSLNLNFRSPLEFFLVTNRRFSIQNSISLIAKIQKDYPKIDKIIIMKYLNYLKNNK
jgi:thioester reductase-like protein